MKLYYEIYNQKMSISDTYKKVRKNHLFTREISDSTFNASIEVDEDLICSRENIKRLFDSLYKILTDSCAIHTVSEELEVKKNLCLLLRASKQQVKLMSEFFNCSEHNALLFICAVASRVIPQYLKTDSHLRSFCKSYFKSHKITKYRITKQESIEINDINTKSYTSLREFFFAVVILPIIYQLGYEGMELDEDYVLLHNSSVFDSSIVLHMTAE